MEKLINIIIGLFAGLKATRYGREILVFIISVLPILELRGGLLAASLLEVDPLVAYIISIIGNIFQPNRIARCCLVNTSLNPKL